MNLNPQLVELEISTLLLAYPELADDEQLRADMIEGATHTFEFLSGIVRLIGETNSQLDGLDNYIDGLRARASRLKHREGVLRELLFRLMQKAHLPNAQLPEATLSIRKGQPQLIGNCEPHLLPDLYRRMQFSVDRTAIKDALKAGKTVDGFSLSNSEPTLSIRRT